MSHDLRVSLLAPLAHLINPQGVIFIVYLSNQFVQFCKTEYCRLGYYFSDATLGNHRPMTLLIILCAQSMYGHSVWASFMYRGFQVGLCKINSSEQNIL